MILTTEQEQFIIDFVQKQNLQNNALKDDLVDHLSCSVDSKIESGKTFHYAFEEALKQLAPNGLEEIEQETIFLINRKRIMIMKKFMFMSGFLGAASLSLGMGFKLLHYPYGSELFIFGFLILFFLFIPLYAMDRYKVSISKTLTEKLKLIFGVLSVIILGLSGLFKIFHWQGSDVLLPLGILIFTIGFLPFLFITMYKNSITSINPEKK